MNLDTPRLSDLLKSRLSVQFSMINVHCDKCLPKLEKMLQQINDEIEEIIERNEGVLL